jgi:hypothetical protein
MEEMRNTRTYRILVRDLDRPRNRLKDNIKMDIKEYYMRVWTGLM